MRARVREALIQTLPTVRADSFIALSFAFMALDLALPKTGPLRERLAEYFDDFPLAEFVTDVLTEDLERRDERYEHEQKLTDLDGYQDPAGVADNFIERFQTLPWSYILTFALPHQLHELIPADSTTLQLSPQLCICRPTQDFQGLYPLETDNPVLNNSLLGPTGFFSPHPKGARAQWEPGAVYFQIQVEGFIGRYALSPTVNAAEHLVRSFFGLGLATEVFKSTGFFRAHSRTIPVYVHRATRDGRWEPSTIYTLSPSIGRGLHSLTVGDPNDALRIEPPDTEG